MSTVEAKVTSNGQISLPAAVRHRWTAGSVLVIDRGEYVIVRPVPDEPIKTLLGAHAGDGPTAEAARAADRATGDRRTGR